METVDTLPADDGELVLELDLESGRHADAIVAAEALIAWVEAIREANAALDPTGEVRVGLVSAEPACLRLRAVLNFVETRLINPPVDALAATPRLKKLVVGTVLALPAGIIGGLSVEAVKPDDNVTIEQLRTLQMAHPSVPLADLEKTVREAHQRVHESSAVREKVQTFYKRVEKDRGITNVSVAEKPGASPLVSIPRGEFAERSGLWSSHDEDEADQKTAFAEWEVIVTHPALVAKPAAWKFVRDGLPFTARMEDGLFLQAIHDGTLPLVIQEGVVMRIRLEWKERLVGQVWEPVPRTRKVTKVLHPRPLAAPAPIPLLRKPDDTEE